MCFLLTAVPHGDEVWRRLYNFPDPQERHWVPTSWVFTVDLEVHIP